MKQTEKTPAEQPFITVTEAADRLRVTRQTVYTWVREIEGFPQLFKLGPKSTRMSSAALDAWILECAEGRAK